MKWAVVGSSGMLGKDLVDFLIEQEEEVIGFHRRNLDLTGNLEELEPRFLGFDIIVNCVGYTKVDQAEIEREQAAFANTVVPSRLAQIADSVRGRLIHISTDYVFDGESNTPYQVDSPKNPISFYGETKSNGEDLVLGFDSSQIVRTSWLYGAQGKCFPRTIARRLLAGEALSVVDDQIGSPTHTKDLAEFIYKLGKSEALDSIWHGVGGGSTSWFGLAREVALALDDLAANANQKTRPADSYENQLEATSSELFPAEAKRPAYSVLTPSSVDGFEIPDWKQSWFKSSKSILANLL